MSNNSDYLYPLPKETLDQYIGELFAPIKIGECVTTVWVASAGRRIVNRFILENMKMFPNTLPDPDKYLLVYIEPLDLLNESLEGYLKLIGLTYIQTLKKAGMDKLISETDENMFKSDNSTYSELLQSLVVMFQKSVDSGKEIALFLGEFDELEFVDKRFCNNLRSLWNRFDGSLHYVFLIKDVNWIFEKSKLGEDLTENFLQNVIYFPLSNTNSQYLIDKFSDKYGYKFSELEKEVLEDVADGHPYFLKVACGFLAKNGVHKTKDEISEALRGNYELRAVAKRILEVQTEQGRRFLAKVVNGKVDKVNDEQEKVIERLGLIKKDKDGFYKPFCVIFKDTILEKGMPVAETHQASSVLVLDSENGALLFNGNSIEEKLTPQEYEVLTSFVKEPNKVKTRDDIGDILWGKDHYDKYSDWAIDQLISKLRKKLIGLGLAKSKLVTLRGRGYKLLS